MLKRFAARARRYCEHPDPRVAAGNVVALMVGANGPLYPIYVWYLVSVMGFTGFLGLVFAGLLARAEAGTSN